MKTQWLDLVVKLSNKIFQKKQTIIEGVGFSSFWNIIVLFLLEIILSIISLPLILALSRAALPPI